MGTLDGRLASRADLPKSRRNSLLKKADTINLKSKHHTPDAEVPTEDTAQTPVADPETLNAVIATLAAERDEIQQQLLRTMAEFQNFRRRSQEEQAQNRRMATQDLVIELLPVLDNFERALDSIDSGASFESVIDGIRRVDRQLRATLENQRVVRIPAQGQPFDPELHEAIAMEQTDEHEEGTILHEVEAGYKMADRVIRPSRVKVAKKKS
jgi:molecular chaperone GrpE